MSSDNEKDFLENLTESQDDSVSWANILDTDEDGIVSIKNDATGVNIDTEMFSNNINSSDDILRDEQQSEVSTDEDIDEEELKRILSEDSLPDVNNNTTYDSKNYTPNAQNIDLNDNEEDEILPRKEEIKKQGVSPIIIALLFAVLASAGAYLIFTFVLSNNDEIDSQAPVVQENINQEDNTEAQSENGAIPVVNEEEVEAVKPDEAQEEKKEVINVVPTGRINPFLPISKYAISPTKVKTINNIDYDSIDIPKPPKQYGEISEYTEKLMSITVSGIMYDKVKPSAIITYENEDYFVQIGDKLNNFKVVGITPTHVMVSLGKNVYKANLGEELKISEFYGNVKSSGNSRQYFSSEDEYTNNKEGKNPYTSNSDVKIYTK